MGGFQGRPNKDEDTCYSFWIGGSLDLVGASSLTNAAAVGAFATSCEGSHGGLAKCVGNHPDVLHSYMALAGLALTNWPGLAPLDSRLGISARAAEAAGLGARAGGTPIVAGVPARVWCTPCE